MLKRLFVFFLCLVFSLLVIWGGVVGAEYYRCTRLEKPLFVTARDCAPDNGGGGIYRGFGYVIKLDGHLSAEYGFQIEAVEMSVLGIPCYSAIACY